MQWRGVSKEDRLPFLKFFFCVELLPSTLISVVEKVDGSTLACNGEESQRRID